MWTDVVDLRDFYASPLGVVARRMIRRKIRQIWPDVAGQRLLGLGYATPYLGQFRDEAERTIALMPAQQGVFRWPAEGNSLTTLAYDTELPFPDVCFDRVLVIHALESAQETQQFLREIWRILSPSGRVLLVVPNRRGIWARIDNTPLGRGLPFSRIQASRILRDAMFTPLGTHGALFVPPTGWRAILASAGAFERIGARWFEPFSGATLIEATKQIYAGTPLREAKRRRSYVPVGSPCAAHFQMDRNLEIPAEQKNRLFPD